jgi:glucose-6-phosphate isomerase
MNKKSIQQLHSSLKNIARIKSSNKKFAFKFESEFLNYQSYLRDFSSEHYKIFNQLYSELDIRSSLDDLFAGREVNKTEKRAALHYQYRLNSTINDFSFKEITKPYIQMIKKGGFTNIITFGIGGSYEGPKLLQEFTQKHSSQFDYYFISGPDKDEFDSIIKPLTGQKNFYIFSSKSLSTDETLTCLKWLGSKRTSKNSIVVTANPEKARFLGFSEKCIIPFPEAVGGRYSIWSPISISAAIENNFSGFLKGGYAADKMILGKSKEDRRYQKFIKTLAFSDLWFSNFRNKKNRVILSYNWKLKSFASYIQQLEMESLGKKANPDSIFKITGQSIFGGFGSTAQHSYFQLLHQGTSDFCADIIFSPVSNSPLSSAQAKGQASLLSSELKGPITPLEVTNSDAPVNLFHLKELSLPVLGFLIASWEHRVFVSACMLKINPFDQFGVAAGKKITKSFLKN